MLFSVHKFSLTMSRPDVTRELGNRCHAGLLYFKCSTNKSELCILRSACKEYLPPDGRHCFQSLFFLCSEGNTCPVTHYMVRLGSAAP